MTRPRQGQALTTTLKYIAAALKIAREGADSVPIAKQILGSAAHCVDLAITLRDGNEAVRTLAKDAGNIAAHIHEVTQVQDRIVDGPLLECLGRLNRTISEVRDVVEKISKAGRIKKIVHFLFVTPERVAELRRDLNTEIQAFLVAATTEANLRIAADCVLYDGEFRRLRHCDIQKKLGVIHKLDRKDDDGRTVETVVYERVRVKDEPELMVLRRCINNNSGASISQIAALPENHRIDVPEPATGSAYETLLRRITLHVEHSPYLASFYGSTSRASPSKFSVMRSGTYDLDQSLRNLDEDTKPKACLEAALKVLSAVHHLHTQGISWAGFVDVKKDVPCAIFVDEAGEPTIGATDDIAESTRPEVTWDDVHWRLYNVLNVGRSCERVTEDSTSVEHCFGGLVKTWMQDISLVHGANLSKLDVIYNVLKRETGTGFLRMKWSFRMPSTSPELRLLPSLVDFLDQAPDVTSGPFLYHTASILRGKPETGRQYVYLWEDDYKPGQMSLWWQRRYFRDGLHVWDIVEIPLSKAAAEEIKDIMAFGELRGGEYYFIYDEEVRDLPM